MIDWHFPRTALAAQYMSAFDTGITDALALFAPRRMGKTEFLLLDMAPEAERRGYRVAYCSFWNLQDNPAKALRLALNDIQSKHDWRSKWSSYISSASAEVSASVGVASVKVKAAPSPDVSEDDLLAIIELFARIANHKKPTLLLLDEVQHLAKDSFSAFVSTLRTQIEQHRKKLHVIYTGSSRDGLQRMFRDRRAAMFHAAQQVDFENLDSEFVAFMLDAFQKASGRKVPLGTSVRVFNRIGHSPALFHHLLRHMLIHGIQDIEAGCDIFDQVSDITADFRAFWNACKAVDRGVLKLLACSPDMPIYSADAKAFIADMVGVDEISTKSIQNAIERLRVAQMLYSVDRGVWVFEDTRFKEWLQAGEE